MAICFHCKTEETQLYENGVPICLKCVKEPPSKRKAAASEQDGFRATLREEDQRRLKSS